jgi:hypothetical protein
MWSALSVVLDDLAHRTFAVHTRESASLFFVMLEALHVEAFLGVDRSLRVAGCHDPVAVRLQEAGDVIPRVSEPLNGDTGLGRLERTPLGKLSDHDVRPASRGFVPSQDSTQRNRLPRDDGGHLHSLDRLIFVRHPAHDSSVRVDVGSRDVEIGTDEVGHGTHVGARKPLEFHAGKLLRIDDNPALPTAIRDSDDRALDGHPERQRLHLLQSDPGVEANPALGGSPCVVVAAPVCEEVPGRAIVHPHLQVGAQAGSRVAQSVDHLSADAGVLSDALDPRNRILEHS